MKSTKKITPFFAMLTVASNLLLAQGSNPPPPVPPPPPGTPIDDWIPYLLILGLVYGTYRVFKSNERLT